MELETVEDDLGPATQEACFVCGETNYYTEGGFYYCSVCNTQSQTVRLYAEEEYMPERRMAGRAQVLRDKKKKAEKTAKKRTFLSTWEIYNILLKHLANQLVEIGFPEVVKVKIFHLYTSFLIRRKVIFVSKSDPEAKSNVTCGEPQVNLYSLYGVKPLKNRKKTSKKLTTDEKVAVVERPDAEHLRFRTRKWMITMEKKRAMEEEYKTKASELAEVDTVFDEVARNSQAEESQPVEKQQFPRLVTTHGVRKLRRSGVLKKAVSSKRIVSAKKNWEKERTYSAATRILEYERFSFKTALILIFVSLRQLGFSVVFSDIMRLFYVGALTLDNVDLGIYKENKELAYRCRQLYALARKDFNVRGSGSLIECFVKYIGIKDFNFPQMKELVPKYCDDFVLPREFECLLKLLNHMFTFDDYLKFRITLKWAQYKSVPEIFVLTQILVLLKMLFGLDDRTEKFQSNFARLVNSVMKEEVAKSKSKMEEWTELFVIEDWFGYLQRRRELVKTEIFNSSIYTPNKPPTLTKLRNLLLTRNPIETENEEVSDEAPEDSNVKNYTEQKEAVRECSILLENLLKQSLSGSEQSEIPKVKQYIPLPLPFQSIVDQYFKNYPVVHDPSFDKKLFQADFEKKRIDFIWNPKKYAKLLTSRGYTVEIIRGDAINNCPFELHKGEDESKVIPVFQPYKDYDDFVNLIKEEVSHSLNFLIELIEEITCKCSDSVSPSNSIEYPRMMKSFGDMYIKSCVGMLIPLMTPGGIDDSDSDSESD